MRGHQIKYTADELAWVEKNRQLPRWEMHSQFRAHFNRHDISVDNLKSLCTRKGWKTGRTGCFAPGITPANKGKKMPFNPNTARTQFKKGRLPHNTKYLGHERLTKDGYVEISIAETNPHTGYGRRYVQKHRYLWEQENGPVPKDMCLKSLDGNKGNTDPANWELIPRALLPRLNGRFGRDYDTAPAQLKPVILNVTKLEHQVRKAQANKKEHRE